MILNESADICIQPWAVWGRVEGAEHEQDLDFYKRKYSFWMEKLNLLLKIKFKGLEGACFLFLGS